MDLVQKKTKHWAEALSHIYEDSEWATLDSPHFPIFPWVTPRVQESIRNYVIDRGEIRKIKKGGYIIPPGSTVNKFCIVLEGFTARSLVSPLGVEGNGIGIAPPQHIATGNLNFFTGRPCFGNYYALVNSVIAQCPTDTLRELAKEDPKLLLKLGRQFESCSLSDRFTFACQGILASEEKMKAFVCGWAANYGKLVADGQDEQAQALEIGIPQLPDLELLGKTCSINWLIIKGIFNKWKDEGLWMPKENEIIFSASLVENIYRWITRQGKELYLPGYPETLQELLSCKDRKKGKDKRKSVSSLIADEPHFQSNQRVPRPDSA